MGDIDGNRKRAADHLDELDDAVAQKKHGYDGAAESLEKVEIRPAFMKLLCPAAHAGALIGKGGSVISGVMSMTGSKIKGNYLYSLK